MEKNPIAQNIKRLREARHWSQEELAAASGVNVRTIQRAESGRLLATESLRALAAAFDTTLEALSVSGDPMLRARKDFEKRFDLSLDPIETDTCTFKKVQEKGLPVSFT